MNFNVIPSMKRSKSECSLHDRISNLDSAFFDYPRDSCSVSESSNLYRRNSDADAQRARDGVIERIATMEKKIDRLNDLVLEQYRLMSEIKLEMQDSRKLIEKSECMQNQFITEILKKIIADSDSSSAQDLDPTAAKGQSVGARSLLDAIEAKRSYSLDREIRNALVAFLQSDELQKHMVSATMESLQDVVRDKFSRELSCVYLPMLQRSQRRLARHVARTLEDGFSDLAASSASFSTSMSQMWLSVQRALEHHHRLMEQKTTNCSGRLAQIGTVIEEVLQKEIKQWRQAALDELFPQDLRSSTMRCEDYAESPPLEPPIDNLHHSKPQPDTIDQLMKVAEINKRMEDGDVNESFERALSAGELTLVVAACRAADTSCVFSPCRLEQTVLLSLAQQLATDMLNETWLKCRYLEEALINLNPLHPATQLHLPLVVGEIHKHLTTFISENPSHVARARITVIVMAANYLLK